MKKKIILKLFLPERQSFEEWNVVSHHFLIRKVKFVNDNRIDMVIWQQIVDRCLISDVLKKDIKSLQQLNTNITPTFLVHDLQEKTEKRKKIGNMKKRTVITVKSFSSSTISLGVKNYRIDGLFWSKIFVIKSQKSQKALKK